MIIEKVFSNIEEESEKLYSILLSEDEMSLFSEFQKEFAKTDKILAKKLGKTIKEIRKNRNMDFSMLSGNSVNHRINRKISDYNVSDLASSLKLLPKGHTYNNLLIGRPRNKKEIKKLGKWGQIEYDHGWGSDFGRKMGEDKEILSNRIRVMKKTMMDR